MEINKLYKEISGFNNLNPSPKVNKAFTRLVSLALNNETEYKLPISKVKKLQKLCAASEYQLELYWANKIIKSKNPKDTFTKFPYLQNYINLTNLEVYSLKACNQHKSHNVVFVGGGPLPLSAVVLAQKYNIGSTVIDNDKLASVKSKKLIKKLGLDKFIKVVNIAGENFNYSPFNTIYIAALAGLSTKDKNKIFKQVSLTAKKGSHILSRSSWGNRALLYRPVDLNKNKMFKPIIKVDPYTDIVNSVIVFENV